MVEFSGRIIHPCSVFVGGFAGVPLFCGSTAERVARVAAGFAGGWAEYRRRALAGLAKNVWLVGAVAARRSDDGGCPFAYAISSCSGPNQRYGSFGGHQLDHH